MTSPPYADRRQQSYGGVRHADYCRWFLPIAAQLNRVLKSDGSFILNIKEGVVKGERSTHVAELLLALKKQGWLWTDEYIWHKRTVIQANGRTAFAMRGNTATTSLNSGLFACTREQ